MPSLRPRPRVFVLEPAAHPWTDWGGYADVLVHGLTCQRGSDAIPVRLERTGPFVPPVTFPGTVDVVVTEPARARLAGLVPELRFREVVKARVARLDWHLWDAAGLEPKEIPDTNQPEDYILRSRHDADLAESLGPLWEVVADVDPEIEGEDGAFRLEDYQGQPLVRASLCRGYNYVSSEFRAALEDVAPEWTAFQPVRLERRPRARRSHDSRGTKSR